MGASAFCFAGDTAPVSEYPQQLVREVIANELRSQEQDRSHWMYESREDQADGRQLRQIVETNDGPIYRVLAVKGQPLSASQQQQDNERIRKLLNNPGEQRKQQQTRDQDAKKARQMMEMLPNAFIYQQAGREGKYVRLSFTPNPGFYPATREAKVFHAMEGIMLVDPNQKRLKKLAGRLSEAVEFGGGFFGHLDKGGTFSVEQTDVGDGHWEVTLTDVHILGRALFFKSIHEQEHQVCSNFKRIPDDLSLAQAADLLTKTTLGSVSTASNRPH